MVEMIFGFRSIVSHRHGFIIVCWFFTSCYFQSLKNVMCVCVWEIISCTQTMGGKRSFLLNVSKQIFFCFVKNKHSFVCVCF